MLSIFLNVMKVETVVSNRSKFQCTLILTCNIFVTFLEFFCSIILLCGYRYPKMRLPIFVRHWDQNSIFKNILLKVNFCIIILSLLKFVPESPMNNWSALVQTMDWHWMGKEPLPEPMLTQIHDAYGITRPGKTTYQWVWENKYHIGIFF